MSVFGPAFPPHGGVVLPAQWATHGGLIPVHGSNTPTAGPAGHTYGPELNPDPGFDTPASWSKNNLDSGGSTGISVSGGKGRFAASGDDCRLAINVGTQAAGTYQIQIDADSNPDGIIFGAGTSATLFRQEAGAKGGVTPGATGTQTQTITPTGSFSWLIVDTSNGGGIVDNLSLKKQLT